MKKVFSILAVVATVAFVACGPSADEKAKMEEAAKRMQDSINAAMTALTATTDSTMTAATDSTAVAAPAAEEKK